VKTHEVPIYFNDVMFNKRTR